MQVLTRISISFFKNYFKLCIYLSPPPFYSFFPVLTLKNELSQLWLFKKKKKAPSSQNSAELLKNWWMLFLHFFAVRGRYVCPNSLPLSLPVSFPSLPFPLPPPFLSLSLALCLSLVHLSFPFFFPFSLLPSFSVLYIYSCTLPLQGNYFQLRRFTV